MKPGPTVVGSKDAMPMLLCFQPGSSSSMAPWWVLLVLLAASGRCGPPYVSLLLQLLASSMLVL